MRHVLSSPACNRERAALREACVGRPIVLYPTNLLYKLAAFGLNRRKGAGAGHVTHGFGTTRRQPRPGGGAMGSRALAKALTLVVLAASAPCGAAEAQQKTVELKLSHWVPPSHPLQKAM